MGGKCNNKKEKKKGQSRSEYCARLKANKKHQIRTNKRCHNPGPVTRNPFFNFLRDYRKQCCGKTVVEISVTGAKLWNAMEETEKDQYRKIACSIPKIKHRARSKSKRRVIKKQRRKKVHERPPNTQRRSRLMGCGKHGTRHVEEKNIC